MPTLILIPGLLCNARLWQSVISGLGDLCEIHVVDHRSFSDMKDLADNILANAPKQFALAGLSMGGYAVMEILRQAPERVTHAAFLNTSARPDDEARKLARREKIARVESGQFAAVSKADGMGFVSNDNYLALKDAIMEMASATGEQDYINQQNAIMSREDSRPLLPSITCPALVIGGEEDALIPREVLQEIGDLLPNCQTHILPDCGHLAPLEQPETVVQLMRGWVNAKA